MRRQSAQSGFTLIELVISLGIIAFMILVAWSTISGTASTKKAAEAFQQRNHEIRVAMGRMVSDISSAYLSANQKTGREEPRTLFLGKDSGTVGELRFSAMAHTPLWADANECEQTQIYYYAESDPDDRSRTNLLRREQRRLSEQSWSEEPAEVDVLLSDIEKVTFEYWDYKDEEWKQQWDSTATDGEKGRLPSRVRITVELERNDDTVKYVTQSRIMMQEELRFFTN